MFFHGMESCYIFPGRIINTVNRQLQFLHIIHFFRSIRTDLCVNKLSDEHLGQINGRKKTPLGALSAGSVVGFASTLWIPFVFKSLTAGKYVACVKIA